MWQRVVSLYDWIARFHFLATTGIAAAGWFVTFIAASAQGWDPVSVWVGSLGAGAFVALLFIAFRLWRSGVPVTIEHAAPTPELSGRSQRMPILDFMRLAAERGWRVYGDHNLEAVDLMDGLRQAGSDAAMKLWGRLDGRRNRHAILTEIPCEHWQEYEFDWASVISATENASTCTETMLRLDTRYEGSYSDIHLEEAAARRWLETAALAFRGQRDRRGTSR
jgi:hypothetical protein